MIKRSFSVDIGPFELDEGKYGCGIARISGRCQMEPMEPTRFQMGCTVIDYNKEASKHADKDFIHYYPMEEIFLTLRGAMYLGFGEKYSKENEVAYPTGAIGKTPYGVPMFEYFSEEGYTQIAWWIGMTHMYTIE